MSGRGSPWLPLSLVVVLATGAACLEAQSTTKHDAEGGHCDCSTQGRWQPLFKPSQILHSEFPEHKYSDSTGGPRPTQLRTVKILPHLMVPLINPLAISIHHQHDTNKDEQHSYNEVNSNSIADNHGARKKKKKTKNKLKDEHYDYGYPFYKGPTYDEEFPSTQRPYSDSHSSFEEHYHNDSQEQMGHFDDNSPHDHHIDHDQHDHHIHHDQHDHHNIDEVSTEAGNTSGEDTRSYEQTGSSGPGPDPTTSNHDDHYTHDNNNYNYNNEEEGSTMSPYYNSEEHKEQIYDSSKYSPHVEHNNAFRFNSLKGSGSKKHKHRDVNKYYGNSKTRGKAMRYPVMSNLNSDSRYPVMSNSHLDSGYKSSPSLKYKHVKRPPKALTFSRPAVPATLHSDLYHPPPPPPPPPVEASPTPPRVLPDRAPIYHAHPPLAIITPLKIILREEAKRFTLLRPPAPGMHHTWTFDTPLASRSNEIALLKKPRVLYVMKTVPHNSLSLIK